MANRRGEEKSVNVPLVIVLALLPVVAGVIWYANKRAGEPAPPPGVATAEAKAYVRNLKLGGVEMKATENFAGAAVVEIIGNITNAGDRPLNRIELSCVFYDVSGLVVLKERVPIVKTTSNPARQRPSACPLKECRKAGTKLFRSWSLRRSSLPDARAAYTPCCQCSGRGIAISIHNLTNS